MIQKNIDPLVVTEETLVPIMLEVELTGKHGDWVSSSVAMWIVLGKLNALLTGLDPLVWKERTAWISKKTFSTVITSSLANRAAALFISPRQEDLIDLQGISTWKVNFRVLPNSTLTTADTEK